MLPPLWASEEIRRDPRTWVPGAPDRAELPWCADQLPTFRWGNSL